MWQGIINMDKIICTKCWGNLKTGTLLKVNCDACKATGLIDDQQISTNYKLSELIKSDTAYRKNIENYPDYITKSYLLIIANKFLEPITTKFGQLNIHSAYRSERLNIAIGGSKTSVHTLGCAVDFTPVNKKHKLKDIVLWCIENKKTLNYDQIIYEGTWIHIGLKNAQGEIRGQDLMMFNGKYFTFDPKDPRVI